MEPTDSEVDAFVEQHPSGCTLDELAEVLHVSRQRAKQICDRAIDKALTALRSRGFSSVTDLIGR